MKQRFYDVDRANIQNSERYLSDKLMQKLTLNLEIDYPNTLDVIEPQTEHLCIEMKSFLKILKAGPDYWVVVSSYNCIKGIIKVYDSKNAYYVSDLLQESIAVLLKGYKLSRVTLHVMKAPQEASHYDSGLNAIANVLSLISNIDISSIEYRETQNMRRHLIKCIENDNAKLTPFPIKTSSHTPKAVVLHTKPIELHCWCHMPLDMPHKMTRQCGDCWKSFHLQCNVDVNEPFKCPFCNGNRGSLMYKLHI